MALDTGDDVLFTATDLSGFDGAPFADDLVASVGAAIRSFAGWHIAPAREAAVENVDSTGGPYVFLQTLGLDEVSQALDVTADPDEGVVVTGYRTHQTARFRAGVVEHPDGWPAGVLNITYSHGYATCPSELLAVAVEVCRAVKRGGLSQRSLGDRSESWRDQLSATSQLALSRYKLPRSR